MSTDAGSFATAKQGVLRAVQSHFKPEFINEMDDTAVNLVISEAYNPLYGARPLRRFLEKQVTTELSRWIVAGNMREHSVVRIGASSDGKLTFTSRQKPVMSVEADS